MEEVLDFNLAATMFIIALAVAMLALTETSLPPPLAVQSSGRLVQIALKDERVIADKVVRVWIVAFNENGDYKIYEANTPTTLPKAYFVAVFTGKKVVYRGKTPEITGYITRNGLVQCIPKPPYIHIINGLITEIAERDY